MRLLLLIFVALAIFATRFIFVPQSMLFGEFVESANFKFFWSDIWQPWNSYLSMGHTNLSFPHSTLNVSGQVFGTFFPAGRIYWLTLRTALQAVLGPYASASYIFLATLLPFITMCVLATYLRLAYKLPKYYPLLASLIYSISPQTVIRLQVGSFRYPLGFALFPLVLLFALKYLRDKKWHNLLWGGLVLVLTFYMQPHFIVMYSVVAGLVFLWLLFTHSNLFKSFLKLNLVWAVMLIITTINIWLPGLVFKEPELITENDFFTGSTIVSGLGADLVQLVSLTAGKGDFVNDYFYKWPYIERLYGLVLIALSVVGMLKIKHRAAKLAGLILFLTIALASATKMPLLGQVMAQVYSYIPLLHSFRDTTKFLSLLVLIYALSIPLALAKRGIWAIVGCILVGAFIVNSSQVFFSGNLGGVVESFSLPKEYQQIASYAAKRILYLAPKRSIQGAQDYTWYPETKNPSMLATPFDSLIPLPGVSLAKAGAIGESYTTRFLSFMEKRCDKVYFLPLVEKTGTDMVIYDRNIREKVAPSSSLCATKPQLKQTTTVGNLDVFMLPATQEQRSPEVLHVLGNLATYDYLGTNHVSLLQKPFIFWQQNDTSLDRFKDLAGQVVIFNTSRTEAALTWLQKDYQEIVFKQALDNPTNSKKYWIWEKGIANKITDSSGDFVFSKIPIHTSGIATISAEFKTKDTGYYVVLVRSLLGPGRGDINFKLDGGVTKTVITQSDYSGLVWQPLFLEELAGGKHTLEVAATSPLPVLIDRVVIVKSETLAKAQDDFGNYLNNREVLAYYSPELTRVLDDWELIKSSPPLSVKIESSEELFTLRQSYSPYWKLGNQKPIIVDGYANGYIVNAHETIPSPKYAPTFIYQLALALGATITGVLVFLGFKALFSKHSHN